MKINFVSLLALGCVLATTACSAFEKTYWERIDPNSAMYLRGQRAIAQLDADVATCRHAVEDMAKLDAMREAMPPDTGRMDRAGVLTYYDTPTQLGERKISHTDFHDFEGCMHAQGWRRQEYVRPQVALLADNNYADTQSVRRTGMTVEEKKAYDAAQLVKLRNSLVKIGTTVTFGIEGYRDHYKESSLNVDDSTNYVGVNASYTSRDSEHYFWTADGRIASGKDRYSSPSGNLSGVPQYEGEFRLVTGRDYEMEKAQGWFSPYIGLGARIFRDLGKGYLTDLNYYAYDRRIEQLYLPIGATWRNLFLGHISAESNLEIAPLIVGRVNSRLQNGGGRNVVNTQSPFTGYTLRGDVMFGLPTMTSNIEIGPYFRYWDVKDSEPNIDSCAGTLCLVDYEPTNQRLQYGLRGRVSF